MAILCDLFGMLCFPLQRLSDLLSPSVGWLEPPFLRPRYHKNSRFSIAMNSDYNKFEVTHPYPYNPLVITFIFKLFFNLGWSEQILSPTIMVQSKLAKTLKGNYCWWKKSCSSWQVVYPIIVSVLYIPAGCWGFLPSTLVFGDTPIFDRTIELWEEYGIFHL